MQCVLAVVDDEESGAELLSEVELAASGTGAEIVVVSLVTTDDYERDQEVLAQIGDVEGVSYERSPDDFAQEFANHIGREHLNDMSYEVIGEVHNADDHADRILELATTHACDHIYMTGKRRSPTGKALFGDRAQQVLLNFDGYVTVQMK